MCISNQELELNFEYQQLVIAAEYCRETINKAHQKRKILKREIRFLSTCDTTEPQKIEDLQKEHSTLNEEIERKNKELKEIENLLAHAKAFSQFQQDILQLWDKEDYYRTVLEKAGSTAKALLQTQGYTLPPDDHDEMIYLSSAEDYIRIGRQDIADELIKLIEPENHIGVFEKAKQEYAKNPNYNWGYVLSLCLEKGIGTKMDKKAAFAIDKKWAEQNHPLALCSLAHEYFIEMNTEKAIDLYRKATAAEQQSFYLPYAFLSQRLWTGEGIEKDASEALRLLNIADSNGCTFATRAMCIHLSEVVNTSSSAELKEMGEKIYFYSKKANERGSIMGKLSLANCYYRGFGVEQNTQQFLSLLNECVAKRLPCAIVAAAVQCQYGFEGIEPDQMRALKLYFEYMRYGFASESLEDFKDLLNANIDDLEFRNAAYDECKKCLEGYLLGNGLDCLVIGLFYQHGILVPKDIEKAILCFKKGADLGVSEVATALVKLSQDPEHAHLVPIAVAKKYFSSAYIQEIPKPRELYFKYYLPLLQTLNAYWFTIGIDIIGPITAIITDYIVSLEMLQKEKQEQDQESEQEISSLSVPSSLGLPTQAQIQANAIASGIPLRFDVSAGVPAPIILSSSSPSCSSNTFSTTSPDLSAQNDSTVTVHVALETQTTTNSTTSSTSTTTARHPYFRHTFF